MAEHAPETKAELDARFSELYRAHLRDVYSYSYYRVGNHHDAEDLTEQTFLQGTISSLLYDPAPTPLGCVVTRPVIR